MKITETSIPAGSLILSSLERIDFKDAYAVIHSFRKDLTPADLAKSFFNSMPQWVNVALIIREKIAKLIGLKTADREATQRQLMNFKGEPGESIALFKVYDKNENELLTGQNDTHLDFRLSFFVLRSKSETEIILATVVKLNGLSGKIYFAIVKPFHKLVVKSIMRRMSRNLIRG